LGLKGDAMAKVIEYREELTPADILRLRNEGSVSGQVKLIGGRLVWEIEFERPDPDADEPTVLTGQGGVRRWNTRSFSGSVGGT
jgi:hypothetical protein